MPRKKNETNEVKPSEVLLKERVRACVDRFSYYEERMKKLAKEVEGSYDKVIFNSAANVWSLARDLLLHGPVKHITDETLSGKRDVDISNHIRRDNDG